MGIDKTNKNGKSTEILFKLPMMHIKILKKNDIGFCQTPKLSGDRVCQPLNEEMNVDYSLGTHPCNVQKICLQNHKKRNLMCDHGKKIAKSCRNCKITTTTT